MIKKVLIWLALGMATTFLILWLASGGVSKIFEQGTLFTNPLREGGVSGWQTFRLPWQPAVPGASLSPTASTETASGRPKTAEEELRDIEREYADLEEAAREAREFGTPSPYRYQVRLEKSSAGQSDVSKEYVRLSASSNNTAPVSITGWSIQSALTGVRIYIPRGADMFLMGAINTQRDILLAPGASAIALSGQSPIGTSFRENLCTGYLNQLQAFIPALKERCPASNQVLPLTLENLATYGDACVDFVKTIPSCESPIQNLSSALSPQCKAYLADTLSYNGCVDMYRYRSDFHDTSWRVYLNANAELWRNTHDVIRLLDAEGRTVDAITY